MTRAADFPYCSARFAAMAHRGGSSLTRAENTMPAFRDAVDLGYRYIETDVQATNDGRLVCFHDPSTDRLTGVRATIADLSADDVAGLAVQGGPPPAFLDEVVEAFGHTRFNIDIKSPSAVEPLARLITTAHLEDRVLVASFSQARISQFRALTRGRVATAMAPPGAAWSGMVPMLSTIVASPAVALQVPRQVKIGPVDFTVITAATVNRLHQVGKVVHVWTINDESEMETLIDLGVDGIITDRPEQLKSVLIRRNLWEDA